ncbi:hypothetical protein MATL_G00098350 [Megalops atlanticus]|uniref:3',5'-cyclic-GMP phosphodiesterase n=1 Tax=Megalops atlanticus TaxID=7932 RepID=A0A9D3Q6S4_MEGAT|nr:hypothetical protein MATL_G00098350 [Megalops atlanticus]
MNAGGASAASAKAPAKGAQKETRSFKSNLPTAGKGGGMPGMEGLGGANVVCPWEAFGEADLNDLAAFGIV